MKNKENLLQQKVLPEDYLEISKEKTIKNLPGLINSLKGMSEEVFKHYVSKSHHNIADWILEGYHNKKLSKKVRKIHKREKMIHFLEKTLKKEEKKMRKAEKKIMKITPPKRRKDILNQLKNLDSHLEKHGKH